MITHLAPNPATERAARSSVRTLETDRLNLSVLKSTDGEGCARWAIYLHDGYAIGVISLKTQTGLHSFGPSLTVSVDPAFQGRGYALEAITAVLSAIRKEGRHRIVHAAHPADNEAAARTLINAGFLYTGRRTDHDAQQALHMIKIL